MCGKGQTMIVGVGNDIVEICRFANLSERFINKVYSSEETEFLKGARNRLAGNFAAKEAVSKALGTGFSKISPSEIKILRDEKGKPVCILCGNAKEIADNLGIKKIFVSISHCREYASATAVAED